MIKVEPEFRYVLGDDEVFVSGDKLDLLEFVDIGGSFTKAGELAGISYDMCKYYINQMESFLKTSLVVTNRGGNSSRATFLTDEGKRILNDYKKISAVLNYYTNFNDFKAKVTCVNNEENVMVLSTDSFNFIIPLNRDYSVGDVLLILLSYDDVFLMKNYHDSSIRNILEGEVHELSIFNGMIRVKVDVGEFFLYSNVIPSCLSDINIGEKVFVGFKACSIGTMKL